jgi:lauroyl/myristoyl acyltransferase
MRNGGLKNVELIGLENLTGALAGGNGAVLVSGHFFASRVAKCHLASCGFPSLTLRHPDPRDNWAGRMGKQYLQKRYMKLVGEVLGDEVSIGDPDCSLKLMARLRSGGLAGIHADVGFSRPVTRRELLGKERAFAAGYLHLAWVAGAPIVPVHCRGSSRNLEIEFDEPLQPAGWADRESFVAYATGEMWRTLETHIRRTPEQWDLWMRW